MKKKEQIDKAIKNWETLLEIGSLSEIRAERQRIERLAEEESRK